MGCGSRPLKKPQRLWQSPRTASPLKACLSEMQGRPAVPLSHSLPSIECLNSIPLLRALVLLEEPGLWPQHLYCVEGQWEVMMPVTCLCLVSTGCLMAGILDFLSFRLWFHLSSWAASVWGSASSSFIPPSWGLAGSLRPRGPP